MNYFLNRAKELEQELIAMRRELHGYAELGFDLPKTNAFVTEKLRSYGYEPKTVGKTGVTCTVGKGGKVLLLRADMDALPMAEESGVPYAAQNGHCHSCGHDCHTAMLLIAAKMLKEKEEELKGTVKFMFQPAEELLAGAAAMVEDGIMENPKVDVALGLHISVGMDDTRSGIIRYIPGVANNSGDAIRISIQGHGVHGSKAYLGVDAINIAAHTIIALQEILALEIPSTQPAVVLVGKMEGGSSCNSVADTASLEVSVRTNSVETRNFLKKRIKEIAESVASTYRGTATVEHMYGMPPLVNDPDFAREMGRYAAEMLPQGDVEEIGPSGGGEDFAVVAEKVPGAMIYLGVGSTAEGYCHPGHDPKMKVNEDALYVGSATYAQCAARYLEENC